MATNNGLVYLIALPLFGALTLLLLGRKADKWGHLLATAMSAGSFAVGLVQLSQMLDREAELRPRHRLQPAGVATRGQRLAAPLSGGGGHVPELTHSRHQLHAPQSMSRLGNKLKMWPASDAGHISN